MCEGDQLHAGGGNGNRPIPNHTVNEPLLAVLGSVWPINVEWLEDGEGHALRLQVLLHSYMTCCITAASDVGHGLMLMSISYACRRGGLRYVAASARVYLNLPRWHGKSCYDYPCRGQAWQRVAMPWLQSRTF